MSKFMSIFIVVLFTPAIWSVFLLAKIMLWFMGLFIVPLALVWNPKIFWLWDNDEKGFLRSDFDTKWSLYVDRAWRNASGNSKYALEAIFGDPQDYMQLGHEIDETVANGFKWRYRQVKFLNSLRFAWGPVKLKKGKDEIYGGFKIGSNVPGFGFTLQSRPWYWLGVPILSAIGYCYHF